MKFHVEPGGRPHPTRVARIVEVLRRAYPDVTSALHRRNAYELLAATILSAQCTDERVNRVTPALFRKYPDAAALARAHRPAVERMIRPTGFFRNKAKSLVGMAKALVQRHGGQVPADMDALLELPGVARKTANVVLGTWFGKAEGVVVDTHVHRIARRLGLTREKDPAKIERDLMAILPREEWIDFSHRLIRHGRRICEARKPRCEECPLSSDCELSDLRRPRGRAAIRRVQAGLGSMRGAPRRGTR